MKRNIGIVLIVIAVILLAFTGNHLHQSLSAAHDLRQQIADVAIANTAGPAPTGALATADASLTKALTEVRQTAHTQETTLAVEFFVLLVGLSLLYPAFSKPR